MALSLKRTHCDSESIDHYAQGVNGHSQKSRKVKESEEQSDVEDIDINLDDESDEESLSSPRQTSSNNTGALEAGTIERVEVVNFMCHQYLKIDLGSKVNFVIGHNGSGKSAILSAITVALGAKANATNRGRNLSALIREDANAALVAVHITNKGPDAYRHDVYGDKIIVERKILKDGVGNYHIRSSSGKIISTKREELTAILDHMVIQVDNQLVILTQDMAREFLNSSSPNEKYKLFMRGTQLAELAEDYAVVRETLDTMAATLKRKAQSLPDLQRKAKESRERYETLKTLDSIDEKIEELSSELSWSQIIFKEKELKSAQDDVIRAETIVNDTKAKLAITQNKIGVFDQEKKEIQEELQECKANYAPSLAKKKEVEDKKIDLETKRSEIKNDINDLNTRVRSSKATIKSYEEKIAKSTELEANSQSLRSSLGSKLVEMEAQKLEKDDQIRGCKEELDGLYKIKETQDIKQKEIKQSLDQVKTTIFYQRKKIEELLAQKSNRLRAYGSNIPEVLTEIERETRWKRQPVGPLGRFVKLKYEEYRETMEILLGKFLNAFLVEHYEDRQLLMSILERNRMGDAMVIVANYDLFDYSHGEPDEKYLTILRALDIEDEWVKRQLIIGCGIEKILLIAERVDAEIVMDNGGPRNVKSCYTAKAQKVGAAQGRRLESLNRYRGPQRFKKEIDSDISEAEEELKLSNDKHYEIVQRKRTCDQEMDTIFKNIQLTMHKQSKLEKEVRSLSLEIIQTRDKIEAEQPVDVQVLIDEKRTLEQNIERLKAQFSDLKRQDVEIVAQLNDLLGLIQEFERSDEEYLKQLEIFRKRILETDDSKQEIMSMLNNARDNYNKEKQRLNVKRSLVQQLEATVKEWTARVREEWPIRVETERTPAEIQRNIEHEETRLQVGQESLGCTMEEAHIDAKEKIQIYEEAKKTMRMLDGLRKYLIKSLDDRMFRWSEFRMFITISARAHFTYYLHKRGDSGYLKFRHDTEKLIVRVSTSDQFQKGSTRHKDSKSLSGGEKSYSQISLLLAMWQGIASPIFCLDEFDVYMDAVNRKQSMRILMDTALEQSESQYIFITPQDASNMKPGPLVTVHRLNDPNRRPAPGAE